MLVGKKFEFASVLKSLRCNYVQNKNVESDHCFQNFFTLNLRKLF